MQRHSGPSGSKQLVNHDPHGYRIAFVDIETAPSLGWVWQKWQTDVISFEQDWYILSFAVRWASQSKTEVYALPDFNLYKREPENDRDLVKKLWEVLDSADLVVAHNGDSFDLPKARSRFIYHNLPPPSPAKTVDTLRVARKFFAFSSNKLNDLATYLQIGQKVETGGFGLWLGCLNGDRSSWAKMKKYNAQDTVLLEAVYERLRAWDTNQPNVTISSGESHRCPACGSSRVQRRGLEYLKSYQVQRFRCSEPKCGKWSRGRRQRIPAELLS